MRRVPGALGQIFNLNSTRRNFGYFGCRLASEFMRAWAPWRRPGGTPPAVDGQNQPFRLSFNASLKVDFRGSRTACDEGLILVRELDMQPGLEKLIEEHLSDSQGLSKNTGRKSAGSEATFPGLELWEDGRRIRRAYQNGQAGWDSLL